MNELIAELATYFWTSTRLPDEQLARLTAAARAAGSSRWDDIEDLRGGQVRDAISPRPPDHAGKRAAGVVARNLLRSGHAARAPA